MYTFVPLLNLKFVMKKLSQLLVLAGVAAFISCGPSAEQLKKLQEMKDSLQKDSIKKVEMKAAAEKRAQDSIANAKRIADSIENAKKSPKNKGKK